MKRPSIVAKSDGAVSEPLAKWAKSVEPYHVLHRSSLDTYDELFPPELGFERQSMRGGLLSRRGLTPRISEEAVQRACSYDKLNSFHKIGGIVIGRDAGKGADIHTMKWVRAGEGIDLSFAAANGRSVSIHAGHASLVHLAAVYAADGRKSVVTITNASDVAAQKVHLHPALVDTALGCHAVQADTLVFSLIEKTDGAGTSTNARQARWEAASKAVYSDRLLYAAAAISALSASLQGAPAGLKSRSIDAAALVRALESGLSQAKMAAALQQPVHDRDSPIASTPSVYWPEIAGAMRRCAQPRPSAAAFQRCVGGDSGVEAWGENVWLNVDRWSKNDCRTQDCLLSALAGAAIEPESSIVSGVRETEYSLEELAPQVNDPRSLEPLEFIVQVVFSPQHEAGDDPWRFPRLGSLVEDEVRAIAAADPATRQLIEEFQQFTVLQRYFRAALDGQLGREFPVEKILDLVAETARDVRSAPTPRWLPFDNAQAMTVDSALIAALDVKGPPKAAKVECGPLSVGAL